MIANKSALLVIDVQNQFVEGLPEEMKGLSVVESVKHVIEAFRKAGRPIIYFREVHRKIWWISEENLTEMRMSMQ